MKKLLSLIFVALVLFWNEIESRVAKDVETKYKMSKGGENDANTSNS